MSELPSVTGQQAVAAFARLGFSVARTKGSHRIMKKPGHKYLLAVPVHEGQILKKGTLRGLVSAAGITVEQFVDALH